MAILLQPDEQVFYPQPYLPQEANELVITNRRMVRVTDAGIAEFPVAQMDYVGRMSTRPLLALGIVLILSGVASLIFGAVEMIIEPKPWAGVGSKQDLPPCPPGAPPMPWCSPAAGGAAGGAKKADDPSGGAVEPEEEEDELLGWFAGLGFAIGGLLVLAGGVFLVRRQRHLVICRLGPQQLEVRCKDKSEQTAILATLGSAVTTAKQLQAVQQSAAPGQQPGMPPQMGMPGMAPQGMPPQGMPLEGGGPAMQIQVDDGGDPVKALQQLKADKDAGKVDQATFDAKRAILLGRLRR